MNPFEYINELKQVVTKNAADPANQGKTISYEEHCKALLNTLNVLEIEMQQAEYNYVVQSVEQKVTTFDELVVLQKELTDEVIIFQPIAIGEAELSAVDMKSLADILTQLRDKDVIKQNMILLPPNINVFKAKLAEPSDSDDEDDE